MKYAEIDNIWTVDLNRLSNADIGRIYFERAKQIVEEALADPKIYCLAVEGTRFRRDYLIKHIGCKESVPSQNPKVLQLLKEADHEITKRVTAERKPRRRQNDVRDAEVSHLRTLLDNLLLRVDEHEEAIASLRKAMQINPGSKSDH